MANRYERYLKEQERKNTPQPVPPEQEKIIKIPAFQTVTGQTLADLEFRMMGLRYWLEPL